MGIHNTRRCVMFLSLNGTQARGRQNLSIFSVKSLNSSKIYVFLTVYHWDKQVIDFFGNYRHLNKSARKTTGELILYNDGLIFN